MAITLMFVTPEMEMDAVAEQMYMREREWVDYQSNIDNFTHMVENLPPEEAALIQQYTARIAAEQGQQLIVESVYNALKSKADAAPTEFAAACARNAAKRAA